MNNTSVARGVGVRPSRGIALALAVGIIAIVSMAVLAGPARAQTACGLIQSRVDAAAAGDTVNLPDGCVYREAVIIKKPVTLVGGPGTEIRGSDVWGQWSRNASGQWVSENTLPAFATITQIPVQDHPYPCEDGTSRCTFPQQVFVGGEPLEQVASDDPQSGQFAVNAERKVLLADDPAGGTVEVTVRTKWIDGRSGGVTVEGFAMKHAANGLDDGAIQNGSQPNWTVRNNDLSYAHTTILALGGATGLRAEGNEIHHAGHAGVTSANDADVALVGNQIHHNNTENFYAHWKAAGFKAHGVRSVLVSGNDVYANDARGIWTDGGSKNITIADNRIHHSARQGITLEISDHAEVYANMIWENGWGSPEDGDKSAGILAEATRDARIYDNTLAWNSGGVVVNNSDRKSGIGGSDPVFDTVTDVLVHDNTVLQEDLAGSEDFALMWRKAYAGGNLYEPVANNRGYDNRYWFPSPEGDRLHRFQWDSKLGKLPSFNATPGEERGSYLSDAQKDQAAAAQGIPAAPERGIDVTPPDVPQITNPDQDRYTSVHGLSVSGTAEPGSTVEVFDGATSVKSRIATSPAGNWSTSFGYVPSGLHTYTVKATDGVNNTSAASDVRRVTVDSQKPATTIDSGPASVDKTASATLSFSSNETATDFECALDGGAFGHCSSPTGYAGLGEGQHAFAVRAVDRAGNTDATPAKRSWTVDTTGAPRITNMVPAEDGTGVALAAEVSVSFSEPMKASSINANTVRLFRAGSSTVLSATVDYNESAKRATLSPGATLQAGARYKAVVSTGAKDVAGIQLDQNPDLAGSQPKAWYFTTRN